MIVRPFDAYHIDHMVERWAEVLVPFYVKEAYSNHKAALVGTGFVTAFGDRFFLVTAHHVANEIGRRPAAFVLAGRTIPLGETPFIANADVDLAVLPLEVEWMTALGIGSIKAVPFTWRPETDPNEEVGRYVLIGYPTSKNKVNLAVAKRPRHIIGCSFRTSLTNPRANTKVVDSVAFYLEKALRFSGGGRAPHPVFKGSSGGPILHVTPKPGSFNWKVELAGVFVEWHKKDRELVASSVYSLARLLAQALDIAENGQEAALPAVMPT